MAKETNQILGHGDEADGIEEYDNPLPDWWLGLFFVTVVYGIGYAIHYHFIANDSQEKRYAVMMEEAERKWPVQEGPTTVAMDAATVAAGADVFAQTCASCHNGDLTGGIGPSLVDDVWIHGSEPDKVLAVITTGVAAKGMPAWGPVLGPKKVQQVAAFVLSKKGTGPSKAVVDGTASEPSNPPVGADDGTAAAPAGAQPLDGRAIYDQNCASCHGADMKGLVGPDLLDDEWIHGGTLADITTVITKGVPEKGMIQWGPILGAEKIDVVARFVHQKGSRDEAGDL